MSSLVLGGASGVLASEGLLGRFLGHRELEAKADSEQRNCLPSLTGREVIFSLLPVFSFSSS